MSQSSLPPLKDVLKSDDVEDPINRYVHRPGAYAIVWLLHRTRVTPNQITLLSMLLGAGAGLLWVEGSRPAMVVGGIVLWFSAILDGADGILARARRIQSEVGRALDGVADLVVAACSLIGGYFHLRGQVGALPAVADTRWLPHSQVTLAVMVAIVFATSLFHVYLYDYYKEIYLRWTRYDRKSETDGVEAALRNADRLERDGAPWVERWVYRQLYIGFLQAQRAVVKRTNPAALRLATLPASSPQKAQAYRWENRAVMRIWTLVSLAPHMYLISICAMFDRLDVYLMLRLFGMNALFVIAFFWQRRVTRRTLEQFGDELPAAPHATLTPSTA